MTMRSIGVLACMCLMVLGTGLHGAITQRWSVFTPDAERTKQLHALTIAVPDANVQEVPHDVPLKERSIATTRRYDIANMTVMTSIISGVPGAVATHTPDVCYTASGYRMMSAPKRITLSLPKGGVVNYFVADFEKKKETAVERLRVRWAWSTDGTWVAPDYARFAFMKSSELFKLYIVTHTPEKDGKPCDDPPTIQHFLHAAFRDYSQAFRKPSNSESGVRTSE